MRLRNFLTIATVVGAMLTQAQTATATSDPNFGGDYVNNPSLTLRGIRAKSGTQLWRSHQATSHSSGSLPRRVTLKVAASD